MDKINRKKVLGDVLMNLVASILPVFVRMFLLLPYAATRMDGEAYGLMLTLVSLMTIVSNTIGNALNNVRLLVNLDYQETRQVGDFNILLVVGCLINTAILLAGTWIYEGSFAGKALY